MGLPQLRAFVFVDGLETLRECFGQVLASLEIPKLHLSLRKAREGRRERERDSQGNVLGGGEGRKSVPRREKKEKIGQEEHRAKYIKERKKRRKRRKRRRGRKEERGKEKANCGRHRKILFTGPETMLRRQLVFRFVFRGHGISFDKQRREEKKMIRENTAIVRRWR